ncbi:ATPase family protein 2 homolog [Schistocerca gregaria]|uniref:ATPase family protein 2 homolog n=1 Tax=Schistocerca gregaria TaxID=7010 RepID=UPI00211EBE0C|nr:ATPase family protein 2 homolog [Schistocerca gregaria]
MTKLQVGIGDLVEVTRPEGADLGREPVRGGALYASEARGEAEARRATCSFVGMAWPVSNFEPSCVGLDGPARLNCQVKLGDKVSVRRLNMSRVLDADSVSLRSTPLGQRTSDDPPVPDETTKLFVRNHLVGQYLQTHMKVVVPIYLRKKKFVVESINQSADSAAKGEIFRVTNNTKFFVNVNKHSVGDKDSQLSSGAELCFAHIGGLSSQIRELREMIKLSLKNPGLFRRYGLKPPRGALLYGPPGTGKTMLARALAKYTEVPCYVLSQAGVSDEEGVANISGLFERAKANAPSLIFIDEIDAISRRRRDDSSAYENQAVSVLLTCMDGIDGCSADPVAESCQFFVLAATNRPNAIDPSLRRPGRFDREIEIPIPNRQQRLEILRVYLKNMPHNLKEHEIASIASSTHGYVGADLSNLCREAGLRSLKNFYQDDSRKNDLRDSKVTFDDFSSALAESKPSVMRDVMADIPKTEWDDIGGYEDVKQKLKEAVEWPLRYPEAFKRMHIDPPKGILLYGPPGCSKTLLAKAVATQATLNFIPVKGPELFSKYVGDSEKAVRDVFEKARAASPSIIFFDELDAVGGRRGLSDDSCPTYDRVLTQMLNELDGIEKLKDVLFLATTNRPDVIDEALMRPGRIDRIIYVGPPDDEARKKIYQLQLKKIPHDDQQLNVDRLVQLSRGLSGAEITSACREACLLAMQDDIEVKKVQEKYFITALQHIQPGITKKMLSYYESFARAFKPTV